MDAFFDFDHAAGDAVPSMSHEWDELSHDFEAPYQNHQKCLAPELNKYARTSHPVRNLQQVHNDDSADSGKVNTSETSSTVNTEPPQNKGARFTKQAVDILRYWLHSHEHYPYPTEKEKESLTFRTGLTTGQISTWLANSRRKNKSKYPGTKSFKVEKMTIPRSIDRPSTPAPVHMAPLERWRNSPPEDEPVAASVIFEAITSLEILPDHNDPLDHARTNNGLEVPCSPCKASPSWSSDNTHSGSDSCSSVYSFASRESSSPFGSFQVNKTRRRSKKPTRAARPLNLPPPPRRFQCTFCTETFKTKHDWQRHEKTLHLSLERWFCTPDGPTKLCPERQISLCVYCGSPCPNTEHIQTHNHSNCFKRPLAERTFYRKDHFQQHLNLAHGSRFQSWSMLGWRTTMTAIKSRCGFCECSMSSWESRTNHLADHFKAGKVMAEWKGDWGFEPGILNLLENEMPPYLIHEERMSLLPYKAIKDYPEAQRTLYDLVKMGLVDFMNDMRSIGKIPTDDDLLLQSRQICHTIDNATSGKGHRAATWFRDLFFQGVPKIDLENFKEFEWTSSSENGNRSYNHHPEEDRLTDFVESCTRLSLIPTNAQLQSEASRIITDSERTSSFQSKGAVCWFKFLINSSDHWLAEFRARAGLLYGSEMVADTQIITDTRTSHVQEPGQAGTSSQWEDITQEGIISKSQLHQSGANLITDLSGSLHWDITSPPKRADQDFGISSWSVQDNPDVFARRLFPVYGKRAQGTEIPNAKTLDSAGFQKYSFCDTNCYQRLTQELARFVASCMSATNPAQHTPTDEEIQRQARWIIFDDDDPWNQTAADHPEWLSIFKHNVGLD